MIRTKGHLHADVVYTPIGGRHFWCLFKSLIWGKLSNCKSVTTHLPLEIMHPRQYKKLKLARWLIGYGEFWKRVLGIALYWENAPLLRYGSWDLKHGVMEWLLVPRDLELCLDTGHLMLGCRDVNEVRELVRRVLQERGEQIRHLHLHENDFKVDQHLKPLRVLDGKLLKALKRGRSYIYEK